MDPKDNPSQTQPSAYNSSYTPQQQPAAQYAAPPQHYSPNQGVVMQPALPAAHVQIDNTPTTKMPLFAVISSFAVTMVFFYWLPGFLCFIPAIILGVAAMHKMEKNDLVNARKFSILSFTLIIVHLITFPIVMFAVVFGSVYGSFCASSGYSYSYYYYYRRC